MPKTVQHSATLPAPPGVLYAMYLDATQHAAFTGGGAAAIAPQPVPRGRPSTVGSMDGCWR
jgi:hypothetical protein